MNPKTGGLTGGCTGGFASKPPVLHPLCLCGFQSKTGGWEVCFELVSGEAEGEDADFYVAGLY